MAEPREKRNASFSDLIMKLKVSSQVGSLGEKKLAKCLESKYEAVKKMCVGQGECDQEESHAGGKVSDLGLTNR